ncbi:MAG: DUF6602 domain-containing protein [Saprospiraceae bacterium]
MVEYFRLVSEELLIKLNQVRAFIKKHNPTIGLLTEEILRSFLKEYIQKGVSVEQGFILNKNGELSKQCDIIIYDSDLFAPFYRINDIVVVPHEAVISIIEIKTTVTKQIFHHVIDYFKSFAEIINYSKTNTHLFIYNSPNTGKLNEYFQNYTHPGDYQEFDHDTFQYLPDTITGINSSFHLRKDYVVFESDMMGYTSYNYENEKNLEISSLELFYLKIYSDVEEYLNTKISNSEFTYSRKGYGEERKLKSIFAIELFHM